MKCGAVVLLKSGHASSSRLAAASEPGDEGTSRSRSSGSSSFAQSASSPRGSSQ